jgi:sulfur relay (sulfurtransferase) DsrC/TusE family protein
MAIDFYKKDGSYFKATDNSKILNPTDLQTLSKAGGKEVPYTTDGIKNAAGELINPTQADVNDFNSKYNTFKPTSTNPTSGTIDTGIKNSNISSNLPSSPDAAMKLYADNSLADSTKLQSELQKNLDKFDAQRIADNKTKLETEQANLKTIQEQKDTQVENYDSQMNPLKDKAVGIYNSMLDSIKNTDYTNLTKQKLDLTNDIVSYSKMFSEELAQAELGGGLTSVSTGRKNQVIENYTSKIAIAQAASSAIDGNFNLAFDIMDKGANAIQNLTTDRINFINTVKSLFSEKETDSRNKILTLTTDQKDLLDQAKKDAETKLTNLQKNKDTIMELMQTNPIIANKAGLSLTDTPEQLTKKLDDFYVKYPQYSPDNQAFIKKAMEKYIDAGITLNDPLATVQSKLMQSRIYQQESQNKPITIKDGEGNDVSVIYDPKTNSWVKVSAGENNQGVITDQTGNTYDISSYATDPNHEISVQNLINGMGQFKSVADIDNYIKSKYPNSPITGQMIYNAAEKYGVSWEAMTAIMAQDSSMGTAGKGARTFNPGNVGNDDSGNIRNYGNWQSGVDAVAQWLSNHKTTINNNNSDFVEGQGYNQKQWETAKSMMETGSTLTLEGIKQADRPGVNIALNKLKEQAKQSGNIYGVMKASAGGAKVDATTVKDIAKFGTSITQLDSLKKEIDDLKAKGGTGAFRGRINEQKFWDADVATIRAKLQGVIPTIARGVFSEVGVLTDQDIENYKNTIPNIKTPTEAIDRIFQGLMETIDSKILNTYESYANAGYDVSGFADTYKELKTKIDDNKYPAGMIVTSGGKNYKSLGKGQFEEIK